MTWYNLLFLHWPVPADVLRPLLPQGLELDTFDGQAWLGIVPFGMSNVRPRWLPSMPWLSKFLEINVRIYVVADGKPGVWFFSLDAANPIAVRAARWWFHLPYYDARMALSHTEGGWIHYDSRRTHRNSRPAEFQARYRPCGEVFRSETGSLEYWLTERYCLYAADGHGNVYRGDILHEPWPLQPAEAECQVNTMTSQIDLQLPDTAPLAHFAKSIDVVAWTLDRA